MASSVYQFSGSLTVQHHVENSPSKLLEKVGTTEQLYPTLEAFKDFIENNATVYQLFQQMFREACSVPAYDHDPNGQPEIHDYLTMIRVLNNLMETAPCWIYTSDVQKGLVGFPFNTALVYPMATAAGITLFSRPDVNQHIQDILKSWAIFLESTASTSVLNSDSKGWFCQEALDAMARVVSDATPTMPTSFAQAYVCDPAVPAYGYKSWDDFSPADGEKVSVQQLLRKMDEFSLKDQPYSLLEMLDNDPLAPQFNGGSVYQAFLSALSYHRWHAPVTGKIVKILHIPGTYFLQNVFQGFANKNSAGKSCPDLAAPNNSQAYLCQKATRLLIFIQADDVRIGLMAVLLVGMAEVSSCEAFVKEGQRVRKGDEIGTFHYGGSTHCLIFRPQVKLRYLSRETSGNANVPVCSALAILEPDMLE